MAFQWIIERAETISINRKKQVAQTTARDGRVRAVSRGDQPDRIEVKLPDGIPWTDLRTNIVAAEALDRITTAVISIPYARFPWFYGNVAPVSDYSKTVICVQFPEWTIFARDQVSWSGPFVFVEIPV
jgi:hypothetical protein